MRLPLLVLVCVLGCAPMGAVGAGMQTAGQNLSSSAHNCIGDSCPMGQQCLKRAGQIQGECVTLEGH